MRSTTTVCILTLILLTLSFCSLSCSSGPRAPEMGTPAFYWAAAKETFAAGDYVKTIDHLDRAMKGSAEYDAQARPWLLVLTGGLFRGYAELADAFETGARANRANPAVFRRHTSDFRRFARGLSLQFAENVRAFETKNPGEQVALAFEFPGGSQAQPPQLSQITSGAVPTQTTVADVTKRMIQRNLILAVAQASGAGEDSSKAQQIFISGEVKVPRNDFRLFLGQMLQEQAELYGRTKLDEPERVKLFSQEAETAIKGLPESKEVKTLNEKIKKALKPSKKTS